MVSTEVHFLKEKGSYEEL